MKSAWLRRALQSLLPRRQVILRWARAARPRHLGLACAVAAALPGCGVEGEGSLHIDRTRTSSVSVVPDRKALMPSQSKDPGGRTTKVRVPRR